MIDVSTREIFCYAQGGPEWIEGRRGCATSSRFDDVMATIKSGEAASRRNYRIQLALERITGVVQPSFVSGPMADGSEREPSARLAFEAATGLIAQEVGLVKVGEWLACSPDGLIDDDEGLECKCYIPANHYATLLAQAMPEKHKAQVQGNIWLSGRRRWHFASWNPLFPPRLQLFHAVVERDDAYIVKLAAEVEKFLAEVAEAVTKLEKLNV